VDRRRQQSLQEDHPAIVAAVEYVAKQKGMLAGVVDGRAFAIEAGELRVLA